MIAEILDEELAAGLGACRHERGPGRTGYRHGSSPPRQLMTSLGPVEIAIPRGRLKTATGMKEFESQIVRRYERRTRRLDAALLACYFAGANTRKIKLALKPLVGGTALSKSAVSRVVKRLESLFKAWRDRDLSQESYPILILDAIRIAVRMARRVVKVPVQAVIGVNESGEKVLLELRLAPSESHKAWEGLVSSLVERNLCSPLLVLLDGNAGLIRSVREAWPGTKLQRCTTHKLENLMAKAPKHSHAELKRDFGAITHAENRSEAEKSYEAFLKKWRKLVPEVMVSLEEAGMELLTFYDFPSEMWKSLRTTNLIERVNEEFRRRVKTQCSFPTEASALVLLFGLIASGTIRMRKIDGYHRLKDVVVAAERKIA
jgi:transposase-like protein